MFIHQYNVRRCCTTSASRLNVILQYGMRVIPPVHVPPLRISPGEFPLTENLINRKHRLHRLSFSMPQYKERYLNHTNLLKKTIFIRKSNYYSIKLNLSTTDSKSTWKTSNHVIKPNRPFPPIKGAVAEIWVKMLYFFVFFFIVKNLSLRSG